jgi:hypothetical protein
MSFNISIKQIAINKTNNQKTPIMRFCRHCVYSIAATVAAEFKIYVKPIQALF